MPEENAPAYQPRRSLADKRYYPPQMNAFHRVFLPFGLTA